MSDTSWQECPNLHSCKEGNRFGKGCVEDPVQSAMGGKPWHSCHCGVDSDGNPPNLRQTDEITRLRAEVEKLKAAYSATQDDIQQTLGKSLGYPWFKDDQKNFPGATEADGVCVGDHVAESLADEAAAKITALRAEVEMLKAALRVYAGPVGGDNFPHWSDGYPGGVMVEWNTIDFGDAARAALGDTP